MTKFTLTLLMIFSLIKLGHSAETSKISPQETTNNWIVINYWAEWCRPCRQEIPELNRLSVLLNETNVRVVGVNYDDLVGDELASVVKRMDIGFPQLNARQQAVFKFPLPAALPATYIVSPVGELKLRLMGKQTLDNILAGLAKVKPDFSVGKITSKNSQGTQ
jgi:thiol-disulfide isomerase/thioredoxin